MTCYTDVVSKSPESILPPHAVVFDRLLRDKKVTIYTPQKMRHLRCFSTDAKMRFSSGGITKASLNTPTIKAV